MIVYEDEKNRCSSCGKKWFLMPYNIIDGKIICKNCQSPNKDDKRRGLR